MAELQAEPVDTQAPARHCHRLSPSTPSKDTERISGITLGRRTVQMHPTKRESRTHSLSRKPSDARRRRYVCGPARTRPEAHDLMGGQRPGPQTTLLAAAENHWAKPGSTPRAHVERADALRSVNLVGRETQEIKGQAPTSSASLPTDWAASACSGIPRAGAERCERCDVGHHASLVVHVHEADKSRIRAQRGGELSSAIRPAESGSR